MHHQSGPKSIECSPHHFSIGDRTFDHLQAGNPRNELPFSRGEVIDH